MIRPSDQLVAVGRTVTLQCVVSGNPPPTVFWSKESQEVVNIVDLQIKGLKISPGMTEKLLTWALNYMYNQTKSKE